jgi:hypothetical protein
VVLVIDHNSLGSSLHYVVATRLLGVA